MATDFPNYRRLLPRQSWMRRGGILLAVWSGISAIALAAGLVVLYLIVDHNNLMAIIDRINLVVIANIG